MKPRYSNTTLRVKNHINGNDVINTLSNGWGDWKHGNSSMKLNNQALA